MIPARAIVLGAALTVFAAMPAQADYPDKPLRLVVPFPPGGSTEPLARILSQKLGEAFGQQLIVDNRPGAGSTIGAEIVAKSPPDGYTLFLGSISNAISAALYPKLNFDIVRNFAPVTLLATTPGAAWVITALVPGRTRIVLVVAGYLVFRVVLWVLQPWRPQATTGDVLEPSGLMEGAGAGGEEVDGDQ